MSKQPKIGVFVCECGEKIGGCLDVPALTEQVSRVSGVRWAGHAGYWCSPGGRERMRQIVAEQGLERVIVAGCAPRTHEAHFRRALEALHPALVQVVNLRDLCAQPHRGDPSSALKAQTQLAMAITELAMRQAVEPRMAHITPHALVIGGGIAGMTAALGLSDADIPVTLIERQPELGGGARRAPFDREAAAMAEQCQAAVRARSNIQVLTDTQLASVSGPVGRYQVVLSNGQTLEAGAIIVATGGQPPTFLFPLSTFHFPLSTFHSYAFVLCDITPERQSTCLHACCLTTLRQAKELKRQDPDAQVTIFFRELYTAGGTYNELVWEAQQAGVNFVRYPAGQPPQAVDGEFVTWDELTGCEVRLRCDELVSAPQFAPESSAQLARMLRLPLDVNGFLADARVRIRPADRIERGIYVCGAAHYPCDAQRAAFEAYSAAARAAQHIARKQLITWSPPAVIDATRCNGCGDCVKVCPFMAVTLEPRQGEKETRKQGKEMPSLAVIDSLICTGCGNCVSVCPVKAAQVPTSYDEQIEAQICAALGRETSKQVDKEYPLSTCSLPPCLLVFACEWSGYSAAEIAGASGLTYPANTRIIRLNCTGRLQPGLILKALEMGAAGVLVLGCAPGVCHYEQGNERCAAMFEQASALAQLMGMGERLKLEWIPPDDGARFVQVVRDFVERRPTNDD